MEKSVGAYDAKTNLPRLLDEVDRGSSITITKHGRPVARLVPAHTPASSPEAVIDALRSARAGVRLEGESLRDMIKEGRR